MENLVEKARKIAHEAHRGQMRKWSENTPYIVHPEAVAALVEKHGGDEATVAAAWVHDVAEDCDPKWKAVVLEQCGQEVYDLMMELTFPTEGAEWAGKPRAEKNVIRYAQMRKMTAKARKIKKADTTHNIRSMGNAPYKLVRKTIDEAYERLDILGNDDSIAEELRNAIKELRKEKGM